MKDLDLVGDAVQAYERAESDAAHIRGVWVEAGRPLTQESNNGMLGRHPLWRVMLESEAHAMRMRVSLARVGVGPRGRGRPPGAVSAADRVPKPRLRSVE